MQEKAAVIWYIYNERGYMPAYQEIASILNMSDSQVSKMIAKFISIGFLKQNDKGRYVPVRDPSELKILHLI